MDKTFNPDGAPVPVTKRRVDMGGPDFYPTPAWATKALLDHESFKGTIWEPACGDGAMSKVLQAEGYVVHSTDLYDTGYGQPGVDFLKARLRANNIVTNPPYHSAEGFLHKALRAAEHKVALLLRLAFLEGANRYKTVFSKCPPSRVWVFSQRVTFYPKDVERKGSGTTAYAWFVWDIGADPETELLWFPPTYKR